MILLNAQNFYKIASIGLLAIFVTMITPSSAFSTSDSVGLSMYGMADVILRDESGNVVFTQTVHNAITNQGEDYLLNQVLGTTPGAEATTIGSICITNNTSNSALADDGSVNTDAVELLVANTTTMTNDYGASAIDCLTDNTVTYEGGIATIGPLTFTAGVVADPNNNSINIAADKNITNILICEVGSTTTCNATLFAVATVDIPNMITGASASFEYKFDMSSPAS